MSLRYALALKIPLHLLPLYFLTMHKLQFTQHRFRVGSFLSRINQTSEKCSLVYLLENFVNFEGEIIMSAKDYQLMQERLTGI